MKTAGELLCVYTRIWCLTCNKPRIGVAYNWLRLKTTAGAFKCLVCVFRQNEFNKPWQNRLWFKHTHAHATEDTLRFAFKQLLPALVILGLGFWFLKYGVPVIRAYFG